MTNLTDICWLDALSQARLVQLKEISPKELVEATIHRIEALNPKLNAVVTPMFEIGLESAENVDLYSPFAGVPFLLKDLTATYAGVRMSAGSQFLKDFVPILDSALVKRYKEAGLVILGKTNTPEFGIQPTTESEFLGPCRNPWDLTKTSGGSSGGSAAAVAAGLVPFAHANDGGGSIRIPASCCGVFGLKPSRIRNPTGPEFWDMVNGLGAEHAVTRSVRDCAALLDCTLDCVGGEPYWKLPRQRPFIEEVGTYPGTLRIAFTATSPTGIRVHKDCEKAVRDTAKLCVELGHEVDETSPNFNGEAVQKAFLTLWAVKCAVRMKEFSSLLSKPLVPDLFESLTWNLYEVGNRQSASEYVFAIQELQKMTQVINGFFKTYDFWLTPTLAVPPVSLGYFDSPIEDPLAGFRRAADYTPFTPLANVTGQPAMSVPLYWNQDNLPIGLQFFGRFGAEATLFQLASQLEEARPWADKRAPSFN